MEKSWIAENPEKDKKVKFINPDGNTKTSGINPKGQLYNWCFTLDMKQCSAQQLFKILVVYCKWFQFQGERGESGYEHWQGTFSLINKEYFSTVKNFMPYSTHLEATRSVIGSLQYCSKENTAITKVYNEKSLFHTVIETLSNWQFCALKEVLEDFETRNIFWYWSEEGKKGKSEFADFLEMNHGALILDSAKCSDIAFILQDEPKIIVFDLARAKGNRINYEVLEKLKNGRIFSTKYKCVNKRFKKPTIIIFANKPPKEGEMSEDRWKVTEIK